MSCRLGPGAARQRVTFLARPRKVTKRRSPRFAALRVPNFTAAVRAAAQLALRAQTVLADYPRTGAEKLAAQRGWKTAPTRPSVGLRPIPLQVAYATLLNPLQPEPRISGLAGGSRRKVSERSEFFRRPAEPGILGVSTDAGRPSFGSFSWSRKKRNWQPGHPRPMPLTTPHRAMTAP